MKTSIKHRLIKLEKNYGVSKRRRYAKILCNFDVLHALDLSQVDVYVVLILPDNGHRMVGGQEVPKGTYLIL